MNNSLLAIGKIVGLHGIKGELKFLPYPGLDDFYWKSVKLQKGSTIKAYTVQKVRTNKNIYLLLFDGFSTCEESAPLVGSELLIEKEELPENAPGEYYQFELVGLDAYGTDGSKIGAVTGIMPAGGNDLLQIEAQTGEVLIPAIEEFILEVDLENKRVVVRLLEGLIPEGE